MAAASAIEALFRPTHRYRDMRREQYNDDSFELQYGLEEVELIPDLSPEHLLETGITWEDFCRFLGRHKLVWMGPGVYVCSVDNFTYRGHWRIAELGSSNHQGRPLHRLHVYACCMGTGN
jgi:hypothetical protein